MTELKCPVFQLVADHMAWAQLAPAPLLPALRCAAQLTDEAHGDNPREATPRDDKQITESDFYTKA